MTKSNNNNRPRLTAAVFVSNSKGEIFLQRSPKWNDKFVPPGGHIDFGEMPEEAAEREVKEETNLDIKNIEFLETVNIIDDPDFYKEGIHFFGFQYKAEVKDENQEIILEDREATEYIWEKPEDLIKRKDIQTTTKQIIKDHFIDKKNSPVRAEQGCGRCEEYKEGWARAQADYQNLQKEVENKRSEWVRMSEVQILEEFIPVFGNFKKAFAFDTNDADEDANDANFANMERWNNWKQGIEYIMKQFGDILSQHNIEEIKTVGEQFNPELHEAVGEEKSDEEEGVIIKEVEVGYKVGDKVIKCAKVIISK